MRSAGSARKGLVASSPGSERTGGRARMIFFTAASFGTTKGSAAAASILNARGSVHTVSSLARTRQV